MKYFKIKNHGCNLILMQIVSKFNENKIQPTENEVSNLGHGKSKYALHFIAHNVEMEGGY